MPDSVWDSVRDYWTNANLSDAPLDEPLGLEPPREPGPIEERRA